MWPIAVLQFIEIHIFCKTAFGRVAAIHSTRNPIAATGHEQSFEQTNKRSECASFVKVIASIEDPTVIQKILAHLDDNATSAATALLPDCRASPTVGLFD
jgi:hypothetical protein